METEEFLQTCQKLWYLHNPFLPGHNYQKPYKYERETWKKGDKGRAIIMK